MSKNEDGLDHIRIPFEKIKFGNKLEVQGYGTIYEGEFEDQKAALKRLNITNLTNIKQKLLDEILTISEFRHHPNLVALLGFSDEKSNEIILVSEYVSSGNLADKMRTRLNTIQRLEICLGAARGLEYLHNGVDATKTGIVHGHIKPSKILLNFNNSKFEAKVSSFGLSKIVPGQASIKSIEDIEKVTKESDVYDFGVLLLEVLCGVSELVDTDDYQERHVTELVPKRLEQDKVRKIVHFDIRKEIKTEALDVYAKIACRCVMESVEARPTMCQVVEELEKALRLQGGEVTYVQIIGNKNIADLSEEIVVDDGLNDGNNSVTMDSNVDLNNLIIEEDVIGLIAGDKLDVAGEDNGDEIKIVDETSDSINGDKNTVEDTAKESTNDNPETPEEITDDSNSNEKSYIVHKNEDEDDNQNRTHIEDVQKDSTNNEPETTEDFIDDEKSNRTQTEDAREESSNDEPETTEDVTDDSNSKIGVKNEDDTQNITLIEDAQKGNNNIERDTTEEITDDSNEKSNFSGEIKDDNQSTNIVTVSESSNIDISTSDHSTNQGGETIDEDDQDVKDNYEKMSLDVAEEEPELKNENIEKTVDDIATIQSSDIPILGGKDFDNVPEITQISDAEKENDENTEEITVDVKSNDESKINGENEIDQESKIVTSSESNDATKESGNNDPDSRKIIDNKITATEIQDSDNMKAEKHNTLLKTGKKPEMIVNAREGNLPFVEKNQESESKRSNSTCSESSNGDSTTPSDYLLPKSPANGTIVKKSSDGSRNCCSCSWWRYISDRVVFYGGQFWNNLVACITWIRGQCSSKND